MQVSRREKRQTLFAAIAIALMVMLVGAPVVQAAIQRVRVKGNVNVKLKDGDADKINSAAIDDMGILQAQGSTGALDVRTFGGGGGFLGAADCTSTVNDGLPNVVETSNSIVTAILITGTDGVVTATSASVGNGQLPLLTFQVTPENPNMTFGTGNGLTVTAPLTFTCEGSGGGDGTARVVILGQ